MESNNFLSSPRNYLVNTRHIQEDVLLRPEIQTLMRYDEKYIEIAMKDLDGNVIGKQERYLQPIDLGGKKMKSKTKAGSRVGYFFLEIDWTKPVVVVEGEIDWLSLVHLPNVIGLQGIGNLKKLVGQLKLRGMHAIYLLVDNDPPADIAINRLSDMDLGGVFDCRQLLGDDKDVNDYITSGGVITLEEIQNHRKSLNMYSPIFDSGDTRNQFVKGAKNGYQRINHNKFAKYLIVYENFAGSAGNPFRYDKDEGIRLQLNKQEFEGIVINDMEKILHIDDIKRADLENIVKYIITHAENAELTSALKTLRQEDSSVCLKDCIYNIISGEKKEYRKEYYIFNKFEYTSALLSKYTDTKPQRWLNFLDDILEGHKNKQQIVDILQEFMGLLFIPNTKLERALILLGNGANGKGVLLNTIQYILGDDNCCCVGFDELNNNQNQCLLFGKLANIDFDCDHDVCLDKGITKKIIDGSTLLGKEVYKKPINFTPFCRLLLAANEFPKIKNKNNATIRRFLLINLKKSFLGKENRNLKYDIRKEKDAIFVRTMQGLKRLLQRGDFSIPEELGLELRSFVDDNDSILQFLESACIQKSTDSFVPNSKIYSIYVKFCKENDFKPETKRRLTERLEGEGYEDHRKAEARGFKAILR